MRQKITIKFTHIRMFYATSEENGEALRFVPESIHKEYAVYCEPAGAGQVLLTLQHGVQLSFLNPGISKHYIVVRDGWAVEPVAMPGGKVFAPILESTLVYEIKPGECGTFDKALLFTLPRFINGILVDRGQCVPETIIPRSDNPDYQGDIKGSAAFALRKPNGGAMRYFCVSFVISNKTTRKNLTNHTGRATKFA